MKQSYNNISRQMNLLKSKCNPMILVFLAYGNNQLDYSGMKVWSISVNQMHSLLSRNNLRRFNCLNSNWCPCHYAYTIFPPPSLEVLVKGDRITSCTDIWINLNWCWFMNAKEHHNRYNKCKQDAMLQTSFVLSITQQRLITYGCCWIKITSRADFMQNS